VEGVGVAGIAVGALEAAVDEIEVGAVAAADAGNCA
jgi:hypothetical protein